MRLSKNETAQTNRRIRSVAAVNRTALCAMRNPGACTCTTKWSENHQKKEKPHRSGASCTSLLWSEADQKIAADFNKFRIHNQYLLALRKHNRIGRSLSASLVTCDSYRPGFVSMNQRTKSENRCRSVTALPCQRNQWFHLRVD